MHLRKHGMIYQIGHFFGLERDTSNGMMSKESTLIVQKWTQLICLMLCTSIF